MDLKHTRTDDVRPIEAVARSCPVVGSYPDPNLTTAAGRKLDEILDTCDVPHDIKIYRGARHGFLTINARQPTTPRPRRTPGSAPWRSFGSSSADSPHLRAADEMSAK